MTVTLEELKGVPEDVISGYTKRTEGDKEVYDIPFRMTDIVPVVCTATRGASNLTDLLTFSSLQ